MEILNDGVAELAKCLIVQKMELGICVKLWRVFLDQSHPVDKISRI